MSMANVLTADGVRIVDATFPLFRVFNTESIEEVKTVGVMNYEGQIRCALSGTNIPPGVNGRVEGLYQHRANALKHIAETYWQKAQDFLTRAASAT